MIVERNNPIPSAGYSKRKETYAKVRSLKAGECAFFKGAKDQFVTEVDTSRKIMRNLGWKPKVRKCEDGVRIWRTV